MIRQISMSDLNDRYEASEMLPQAILSKPASYFSNRLGIEFSEDSDDFDLFQGAAIVLDDTYPIAIKHYSGHPAGTVTIYLSSDIRNIDDISEIINVLLDNFHISRDLSFWERAQSPEM